VGDVLLAAAFVSYAGPFNMSFRRRLVEEKWLPDLEQRAIPMTSGIKPLHVLSSNAMEVGHPLHLDMHCFTGNRLKPNPSLFAIITLDRPEHRK